MNTDTRILIARTIAAAALLFTPAATALAERGEAARTRPGFERGPSSHRPAAKRPARHALPEELEIKVVEEMTVAVEGASPALENAARRAGAWAAREIARTDGRREYYRLGFFEGLRLAVDDTFLGRWDHLEGVRMGGMDAQARSLGAGEGSLAAEGLAGADARGQVEGQFLDLTREPRIQPRPELPLYTPPMSWAEAPTLGEVFAELPVPADRRAASRFESAFDAWRFDAWDLYRSDRYDRFHDRGWRSADRAWDVWRADRHRARVYRNLRTEAERGVFRTVFRSVYRARLAALFDREIRPSYRRGFDDGWDHGARIRFEFAFRQGYVEGFDRAATVAALAAFEATYLASYDLAYREEFAAWSGAARPAVLDAVVRDANDDGIIQPGETVIIDYRVANYGGAAGRFTVRLSGRDVDGATEVALRLPRRSVVESTRPVTAFVRPATPARTRSRVELAVGEASRRITFLVSWPLEFEGRVSLDRTDTLAGQARIAVRVVNRSRRPVPATVNLVRGAHDTTAAARDLGTLPAGAAREAAFDLSGLRPLDVLSGALEVEFEASSVDTVQDRLTFRFPDVASDLGSSDLLRYLIALANDPAASPADIAEARGLFLRRLRADWRRAARASGNPYKRDLKRGGTETALGELVVTARAQRRRAARPEVFGGLGEEIVCLARDLPGIHPFLRRSMKKLARRI